ncbi:unnamed protein product [Vicia faba]|uniref:Uncharacterized protein n=1 Tax=Vicia faba TaxID=3906 RepID=A0AAV1AQL6_VICFA|nr:unnamed protein product [Vicia faba]
MPSSKHNTKSSNPNRRSSESSNHLRRSLTGNPFSKPSSLMANPRSSFSHTPANSPIDFPRKSFDYEKENVKDQMLKPGKIRSPSPAATSKSSKNFMSPTISASFKIAESPRRKILAERNETGLSSEHKVHVRKVTFADPLEQKRLDASIDGNENRFPCFECDDNMSSDSLSDYDAVSLISKDDLLFENMPMPMNKPLIPQNEIHTESSFKNVSMEPDFVNLDPTFKLSPPAATPPVSYTHTVVDPVDADPSMPPYDHKTNYLSPRPQFLHYRPKPQMELEDRFIISTSFSDSEVTEDTQSEESLKESEDVSSDETVKQEEELISEPSPVRTLSTEETVEAKDLPKSRFSLRSKAVALILLLSIAFVSISVTNSPGVDHAVLGEFYEAYKLCELSEFARANFDEFSQFSKANYDGLARNLHIWFTKSLSSITELISDVRGARNLVQLQYFNLTMLNDYSVVNQYPTCGCRKNEIGITHPHGQEQPVASEIAVDAISEKHYDVYEEQLHHGIEMATGFENALDAPESEEVHNGQPATIFESEEQALQLSEIEHLDAKLAQEVDVEDVSNSEEALEEAFKAQSVTLVEPEQAFQLVEAAKEENQTPSDAELAYVVDIEDAPDSEEAFKSVILEENQTPRDVDGDSEYKPNSNSEAAEIHTEDVYGEGNVESDAKLNGEERVADLKHSPVSNSEAAEIQTDDKEVGESASSDAAISRNEELLEASQIPQNTVLYLLLCAGTIVIAGATLNWSRKVKSRSNEPKIESENNQISPDRKPSLRNAPVEMDVVGESSPSEMVGESCPSEMSSFEKNSSSRVSQLNEAASIDKKRRNNYRRESLVSSDSMDSPSYGSLTVFEKIPKGRGDDETVTPVRRSSRIRSLATSPV